MFEGENGDMVKNILTDGQWKPNAVGGYKTWEKSEDSTDSTAPIAFKIVLTIFILILLGALGFGVEKFLVWIF